MRVLLASAWLLFGAAITGGIYWAFLITPESSVPALLASAVLITIAFASASFTVTGAIEILQRGFSTAGLVRAMRGISGGIPAAMIVLLFWWITTRAEAAVAMRSGEISAFFIARFGWADVSWLFRGLHGIAIWLRWVMAAVLAASVMTAVLSRGWVAAADRGWMTQALRPRSIVAATLSFVLLIVLPWTFLVPWRPPGLPATFAELAFTVAKLTLAAIVFSAGASLILREATRATTNH